MAENYKVPRQLEAPTGTNNPVSEATKKKIARNMQIVKQIGEATAIGIKNEKAMRRSMKLKAVKYASEYRKARLNLVKMKREARAKGGFYREDDPKVMFVIRLKGINKIAPKPKKILQLLRLRQIHNGVFLRVNRATTQMIKFIEPLVTYGYLNLSTIRKLMYKRAYAKIGPIGHRQRVRIQDPKMIADHLGKFKIESIEDMIHELYTCGSHFKEVSSFLWPFKLKTPKGGYVNKKTGFAESRGGDWGNRENLMSKLIDRMI